MIRLSVHELLERQREVIKAIDFRMIAVRDGAMWRNGVAVIRFSALQEEQVAADQARIKATFSGTRADNMRVILQAFGIEFLTTLRQNMQASRFEVGGVAVQFASSFDILEMSDSFPNRFPFWRPKKSWPVLESTLSSDTHFLNTESARRSAQEYGSPNAQSLQREAMELNLSIDSGIELLVDVPFYATVRSWDLQEATLRILFEAHRILTRLKARVFITPSLGGPVAFRKEPDLSRESWDQGEDQIARTEVSFEVEAAEELARARRLFVDEPKGYLSLILVHEGQPSINVYEEEKPLDIQSVGGPSDILCSVLELFCAEDKLMPQLLQPNKLTRKSRIGPQHVFERAVSWLLTACGFRTILLEEYEKLYDRETGVELESIDAIAWHSEKKVLLLVACTLGRPKSREMDSVIELKLILDREIPALSDVDVRPVTFCQKEQVAFTKDEAEGGGIVLIGTADIERLWELAKRGDQDGVLSILSVPENL